MYEHTKGCAKGTLKSFGEWVFDGVTDRTCATTISADWAEVAVPNISLAASLVVGSFLPAQHNMQEVQPVQRAAGSGQHKLVCGAERSEGTRFM
jgi:hypothetical protein